MYKKIAVLRANALGDFIFALPALTALREKFPDSEIVLLGRAMHQKLLSNRPSPVDRVVVVPPYPGVGEAEDFQGDKKLIEVFFEKMRAEQFDVAIQIHGGGGNSNPFIRQLGAKLTVGLQADNAPPLDINIPYTVYVNEVLRFLEVVSYLGAYTRKIAPCIQVVDADQEEINRLLFRENDKPVVVIQPGATDTRRRWPVDKFSRVADVFASEGYLICFNGVVEEVHLIEGIIDRMVYKSHAVDLSKKLSLGGLIGLLEKADLMISNDTGPLHVAHALDTPAVGIYWAPNMITSSPVTTSKSRPLIAWNTNCPLCGSGFYEMKNMKGCDHNTSFVNEISTEKVIAAAKDLLKHNKSKWQNKSMTTVSTL